MSNVDINQFSERDEAYYHLVVGDKGHLGLQRIREKRGIDEPMPTESAPKISDVPAQAPVENKDEIDEAISEPQQVRKFPIRVTHAPT